MSAASAWLGAWNGASAMQVAEYDRHGGPDVLVVRDRPRPEPGPGQVLIRVHAAALNPKDFLIRAGKFRWLTGRRFPRRTGYDWAGEVVFVIRGHTGHLTFQREDALYRI